MPGKAPPTLTLQNLCSALNFVDWYTLGVSLDIDVELLDKIKLECVNDFDRCLIKMLDHWLKNDDKASWTSIITALENMNKTEVAVKIKQKYANDADYKDLKDQPSSKLKPEDQPSYAVPTKHDASKHLMEVKHNSASSANIHEPKHEHKQSLSAVEMAVSIDHNVAKELSEILDEFVSLVNDFTYEVESSSEFTKIKRHCGLILEKLSEFDEVESSVKLVEKLKPYYSFLTYKILSKIIKKFFKHQLGDQLKEYNNELNRFMSLNTIEQFTNDIRQKHYYSDQASQNRELQYVKIKLQDEWLPLQVSSMKVLVKHLFKDEDNILNFITVDYGSVIMTWSVPESAVKSLVAAAQQNMTFMKMVGVLSLSVGIIDVYTEQDHTFSFDLGLRNAAEVGENDIVKFLLEVKPELCQSSGPAVFIAIEKDHTNVAETLLASSVHAHRYEENSWSCLMKASEKGHINIVNNLLKSGADVNHQAEDGWSSLMLACQNNHIDVVKVLAEKVTDINHQESYGYSSLMKASENGYTAVVKVLLESHANVNHKSKDGWSSLMVACENIHTDVVKVLLDSGADVNHQENNGWNCLLKASENGYSSVVKVLLESGANVNHQANDGWSSVMISSQNGHTEVVEMLLQSNASITDTDDQGYTALHHAAAGGHKDIFEVLLKNSATVSVDDIKTAYTIATKFNHNDLCEYLQQKLASMNSSDKPPQNISEIHSTQRIIDHFLKYNCNYKMVDKALKEHFSSWQNTMHPNKC